ncbi:MAG: hypothetical protein HKO55_07995 [Gammaproteobacteria bacterium]|nr:hypothetical protein [Gammaproteobacteria bacterium]
MPHSDKNLPVEEQAVEGQSLAVVAESLYVANLLILPLIAFFALVYLFFRQHGSAPPLARSHLEQTLSASIGIAIMFFACAVVVMLLKYLGLEDVGIWMIVVIVFTIIHATMVLFGVLGLAKAMSGKCWRYPVFGKALPRDCPQ